jgi:hypothetical protein
MDPHRNTFTLRQLFASITCFAFVVALISINARFNANSSSTLRPDVRMLLFFFSYFACPFAIGGGISVLKGNFWRGARLGVFFALGLFVLFVLLMPTVRT